MTYTSLIYYIFVFIFLIAYYVFPKKLRWFVLLAASMLFYYITASEFSVFLLFLATIACSWLFGLLLRSLRKASRPARIALLWISVLISAAPLLLSKGTQFISGLSGNSGSAALPSFIGTLGLSFYTLQIIAYLADIFRGTVKPVKNPLKYALFISFFPQIIQGPIPRYEQLGKQLFTGHKLREDNIRKGFCMIIWGFFLKMMIADKASVFVNAVFDNYSLYKGGYFLAAGILYSIQLYSDFLSCVCLSQGTAQLFGIRLENNFRHPYFSRSIREFWHRWHISLSTWLRDYIYIPLGGSRKGTFRKYLNLVITFAVSGIWHGGTYKFLFWGLLHAAYQIIGSCTQKYRDRICAALDMPQGSLVRTILQTVITFFLTTFAWIIFRAESLHVGLTMIRSIFTDHNPWVFFDDSMLNFGLDWKQFNILYLSIGILIAVSFLQERTQLRDWILRQHLLIRWSIIIGAIAAIWIFGTYGINYDAASFIYSEF